jgi:hypothetical protein
MTGDSKDVCSGEQLDREQGRQGPEKNTCEYSGVDQGGGYQRFTGIDTTEVSSSYHCSMEKKKRARC